MLDVSMAGLAPQLAKHNVTPVRKENMIGLEVNPLPTEIFPFLFEVPDLRFFRAVCHRIFMALEARVDARQSREGLGLVKTVAGVTVHAMVGMGPVIKRDRLI